MPDAPNKLPDGPIHVQTVQEASKSPMEGSGLRECTPEALPHIYIYMCIYIYMQPPPPSPWSYAKPCVLARVPGPLARVPGPLARVPGPTGPGPGSQILSSINSSSMTRNGNARKQNNQDLTSVLTSVLPKNENDLRVDTHILV